jgi:hypothetical protein
MSEDDPFHFLTFKQAQSSDVEVCFFDRSDGSRVKSKNQLTLNRPVVSLTAMNLLTGVLRAAVVVVG